MILPLTPWPIVFYYQTLGDYSLGRHSANALHAIANQVIMINLGFSIVGIIMALLSGVSGAGKAYAIAWIILHHFIFFFYIINN